ncbi:ParB-like partition protein [Paraburkholderia piptadeniae]|uniref:ParB-like partition protein n=1 Tax=Paraburkholderia piptadeniae TaxID=1701573 RepID=A0A1N7ST09_9BURK|nr:ParB N-terminal domain-containing protein [Paraburkholderia piptadeniae]SIT50482.1 ParB-like partition protein [Paraburkholderia piptadeniae]
MEQIQEIVPGNVKDVMRTFKTGVADVYMVRLDALRVRPGFNAAREADPEYPLAVREYAESMKANGFFRHKPLKVSAASDGFLYIADGHTRFAAVQLANSEGAGIESVPVINEMRGTTEEDRIFGLILDNNGRKLTPLGEAMVIKQLLGRGIEEKEIARRLGYSVTTIAKALTLVAAPAPIREMVASGEVSATTAVKAIKENGAEAVAVLEEAKATAKAAGKTKVTEKHLKPKATPKVETPTISETDRLNWIEVRRDVAIRQWYREGQVAFWQITDSSDEVIAEGPTLREAIDNAIEATKDEG